MQIELEGGGYIENDDGSIYGNVDNFCGVEGLDGVPLYIMKNNGLSEVQILLTYDEDLYTGDEMLDLMSEKFTKLYGKDKGAIDDGSQYYDKYWETKYSRIAVYDYADGLLFVDYKQN